MIELQDIMVKIAECKEQIEKKINHSYLQKYFSAPTIDEDKLLLLLSIYEDTQLPIEKVENYVVTTMLVQLALDTHEMVPKNTNRNTTETFKHQQLTVLAGDYYSGLYYYFLSQTDDIQFIRALAEGIKDVNEHKIYVYHNEMTKIDKLINSIIEIEISLIRKIFNVLYYKKWEDFSEKFLILKRLIHEREIIKENGTSFIFEAMKQVLFINKNGKSMIDKEQETYLLHVYDKYIEQIKKQVEKLIYSKPTINQTLLRRMKELVLYEAYPMNKIVEEG